MLRITRTVAPADQPVFLDDVKRRLKIDDTSEDVDLSLMIDEATQLAEEFTARSFITQTWQLKLDGFPSCGGPIKLPRGPVQSVSSVSYEDTNGDTQTWGSGNYQVVTVRAVPIIVPEPTVSYPATESDREDAITITYVAGYGDKAGDVPPSLRQAILNMVGTLYCGVRGDTAGNAAVEAIMAAKTFLWSYRVGWPTL